MLLSAVSVLVVAQSSSQIPEGLMNNPVFGKVKYARLHLKCDGTRSETRVRLSAKRARPFKSAGASVQSTTGSRGVRISGSNAGYTMFRGGVKGTGYLLHSPVSPSLPLPCVNRVPSHFSWTVLHVSVTSNHHQADISVHGLDLFSAYSLGSHMKVTCNRNMYQTLHYWVYCYVLTEQHFSFLYYNTTGWLLSDF